MRSVLGQWLPVTVQERKTLLAVGAAAGMAAVFGTPVAALLLAGELLLFEWSARSLVPVAIAVTTAAIIRIALEWRRWSLRPLSSPAHRGPF